jgi:hypothetical protein
LVISGNQSGVANSAVWLRWAIYDRLVNKLIAADRVADERMLLLASKHCAGRPRAMAMSPVLGLADALVSLADAELAQQIATAALLPVEKRAAFVQRGAAALAAGETSVLGAIAVAPAGLFQRPAGRLLTGPAGGSGYGAAGRGSRQTRQPLA